MDALRYLRWLRGEAQGRLDEARSRRAGPSEQLPLLQEINSYDAAITALAEAELLERQGISPFRAAMARTGRGGR